MADACSRCRPRARDVGRPGHAVQQARLPVRPLWLVEKEAIEQAIASCDGNIPKAAALLEISPSTIYRKKQSWEEASLASRHICPGRTC